MYTKNVYNNVCENICNNIYIKNIYKKGFS